MAIVLPNRTTAPPTREAGLVQSPLSVVVRRTAPAAHVRHCDAPVALDGNTGRGWHRGRTVGQPDATGWRPSGAAALLCGRPPLRCAVQRRLPPAAIALRAASLRWRFGFGEAFSFLWAAAIRFRTAALKVRLCGAGALPSDPAFGPGCPN